MCHVWRVGGELALDLGTALNRPALEGHGTGDSHDSPRRLNHPDAWQTRPKHSLALGINGRDAGVWPRHGVGLQPVVCALETELHAQRPNILRHLLPKQM